jgi:hypothetical protein
VSCICATYNRPLTHQHLLEEAIESFLRQTYPHKELLVLNDCPGQELVCDAPGVRVVNWPERIPTLGDKHNAAIALARGELIAPWDDDDISLPWRLALSVERLGDADYFNPLRHWYMAGDAIRPDPESNIGHNLSLFSRTAFEAVGGYPSLGSGVDLALDTALRAHARCVGGGDSGDSELATGDLYYIYRWDVSPIHLSRTDSTDDVAANPNARYERVGARPVRYGRFVLRPGWRREYVADTRRLAAARDPGTAASPTARPAAMAPSLSKPSRRAIVCFVEDNPHLVQQVRALHLSWVQSQSADTDLVVMGPEEALEHLPADVVKIAQQPAADDAVWGDYRYINGIACLNGAGSDQLGVYSHLLRTDADTFITPAWNQFSPTTFTYGQGAYGYDEDVQRRIHAIAAAYGLRHWGMSNIGTSWFGPTAVVRRAAAFTELLTKHLLTHHFARDAGAWPGWYRGVALRYAGEIAINHCAPDAQRSDQLDAMSTSDEPITRYAHIHCAHTDELFSKHAFMDGCYTHQDVHDEPVVTIRNYCLALSLRSAEEPVLIS